MNEIDELYEKIQLADESLPTPNFNQTNVNYPKNPYTNEIYEANDLYRYGHRKGFNETFWLTEEEIKATGLQLKPDEIANFIESDLYQNDTHYRNVKFYNVEQLDKASFDTLPIDEKPTPSWVRNDAAEEVMKAQKITILHNSCSSPRYNPINHSIHMPHPSQYDTAEGYYNDLFHEFGHSTAKQLNRTPTTLAETVVFARKEALVAELTAIKLCALFKI